MSRFTLTIDDDAAGQNNFGQSRASERGVIMESLHAAIQAFAHTHTDDGEKFTGSIALSGRRIVGHFTYTPRNR
jgi:hypothetical protein